MPPLVCPLPFSALAEGALRDTCVECVNAAGSLNSFHELEAIRLRSKNGHTQFSLPAWLASRNTPPGWIQRTVLLRTKGRLRAAVALREQTIFGIPTGYFRGGDALGEPLILCEAGHEDQWLSLALGIMLRSRSAFLILLDRPAAMPLNRTDFSSDLQVHSIPQTVFWKHELQPTFDATLAPFGHRTRRNLRLALRRVEKNSWQFHPDLTPAQTTAAVAELATSSTHPYSPQMGALRLQLAIDTPGNFAMGLTDADGKWLSCLIGRRISPPEGSIAEVFWQSNASGYASDSLCTTTRALFMREEIAHGSEAVGYLGGTSPLMQHCCSPSGSLQSTIGRPGLRLRLARALFQTPLPSAAHPLRKHL